MHGGGGRFLDRVGDGQQSSEYAIDGDVHYRVPLGFERDGSVVNVVEALHLTLCEQRSIADQHPLARDRTFDTTTGNRIKILHVLRWQLASFSGSYNGATQRMLARSLHRCRGCD